MSTGGAVAGWYPDPAGAGSLRWWGGRQWTEHTHAAAPGASPPAQVAQGSGQPGWGPSQPGWGPSQPGWGPSPVGQGSGQPGWGPSPVGQGSGQPGWGPSPVGQGSARPGWGPSPSGRATGRTGWGANRFAYITFIVCLVYIAIAAASHYVFIGILPLFMSIRSLSRRERLAPVALAAAILVIVVSILFAYA